MNYQEVEYQKVGWEDIPSTASPINSNNLIHMEDGIVANSEAINSLAEDVEDIEDTIDEKQDKLVAGENIVINEHNVISSTNSMNEQQVREAVNNYLEGGTVEGFFLPDNIVLVEDDPTIPSEEPTIEALFLNNLTLESDGTYIYLKYGEVVLGMVECSGSATVYCESISIDSFTPTFDINHIHTYGLTATVLPVDCTQIPRWYSSDESVATISQNGVLTIVGVGTATISVRCGEESDSVQISVVDNSIPAYFGRNASWSYGGTPTIATLGQNGSRGFMSCREVDKNRSASGTSADTNHEFAISITAGETYKFTYTGEDTNWYIGYAILSDSAKLVDSGWKNIGSLGTVEFENDNVDGKYLYASLKSTSGGVTMTDELIREFNEHIVLERVVS